MRTKTLLFGVLLIAIASVSWVSTSSALGLKIAPLEYKTTLKANERQTGFIDVSNPTGQSVHVRTSVQAFKQIDNDGGLQFYDDELVAKGIHSGISEFELGPREALRIFFTIDSSILPRGDIYAAIFFTTDPTTPRNGVGQLVRAGTILSIVNQNPGSRSADVTGVSLPLLQFSDTAKGTFKLKNTGPVDSGFYPTVTVSSWPNGKERKVESPLVFGGRERKHDFELSTGFGIHYVKVGYDGSEKGQWIVTIAPWMLIALILVLLIAGIELLLYKRRHKSHRKKTASTS